MENKDKNLMMIVNDISRMFRNIMRERTIDVGILDTYRPILCVLGKKNGCTQNTIVKETLLKAPTISLTLNNMERDELIIRKSNEEDKRIMNIYITDKGKKINERFHMMAEETKDIFLQSIDENDLNMAKDVLLKIMKNAEGACTK